MADNITIANSNKLSYYLFRVYFLWRNWRK